MYGQVDIKYGVVYKQPYLIAMLCLDFVTSIIFGVYYEYNYYLMFSTLFGMIGVYNYRPNWIHLYQFFNMTALCLRIYTIFLTQQLYFWVLVDLNFYTLYKYWYFIFELKLLDESNLTSIRNGWIYSFDRF